MPLKIQITIEPHGDKELRFSLYDIDIVNEQTSTDNHADYSAVISGGNLKRPVVTTLENFNREKGAIALLRDILDNLLRENPHKFRDPDHRTRVISQEELIEHLKHGS